MKYVLQVYRKYAVFNGRARRREYWSFAVFFGLVLLVMCANFGYEDGKMTLASALITCCLGILILMSFLPALALRVRRLHDIDRSGFWCLVAFLPFVGELVLLTFSLWPGTKGANRFGPDPKVIAEDVPMVFS